MDLLELMMGLDIKYYDRIDISERIDINKTSASRECDICPYWYFSNKEFKFQSNVCNGCHDILCHVNNIAIWNIQRVDYRCNISGISKLDPVSLLQNSDLTKRKRVL